MRITSYKTTIRGLLFTICALWILGCSGCNSPTGASSKNPDPPSNVREPAAGHNRGISGMDFDPYGGLFQQTESSPPPADSQPQSPYVWSIVLQTFTEGDHRAAAGRMISQLPSIDPILAQARSHTTSSGSMVVYGEYDSPDSSAAQSDLDLIKGITISGRPVFGRAMLSRINLNAARGQYGQYELLSVRQRYPNVDPLYTLDIAIWGTDEETGSLTLEQAQAEAEAYARRLRAQGVDAYYHHDPDRGFSTVTVGLFDHNAIDPASGLYHRDVQAFLRRFPNRLVNGEPLHVYIDPQRPDLGTEAQAPRLVLVPDQ